MRHLDHREIVQITGGRAFLETELARRMYRVFNTEYITPLRDLVALAMEQVVAFASRDATTNALFAQALDRKLAVWRGKPPNVLSLKSLISQKSQWTAADCSDLIRLFGGVIENAPLQQAGLVGTDADAFRSAQRAGGPGLWAGAPGPRARVRADYVGAVQAAQYPAAPPTPTSPASTAPHIIEGRMAMLKARRAPGDFAGIENTLLVDQSSVRKIDFVFGLPAGCDISGTTADSIFFFRHVNAFVQGLDEHIHHELLPAVQLLPMATMASQAHHTVLECALPLSLNHVVDYRIGFYGSLLPTGHVYPVLRRELEWADRDYRNKRILCYRGNEGLEGILFDRYSELEKYSDAARVSVPFMIDFLNMSANPRIEELYRCGRFRNLLTM